MLINFFLFLIKYEFYIFSFSFRRVFCPQIYGAFLTWTGAIEWNASKTPTTCNNINWKLEGGIFGLLSMNEPQPFIGNLPPITIPDPTDLHAIAPWVPFEKGEETPLWTIHNNGDVLQIRLIISFLPSPPPTL